MPVRYTERSSWTAKALLERTSKSRAASDPAVKATTAADGAYRINVPQQGQCTLVLPDQAGKPSAMVFSAPNPALYNFELVKAGNGYELKRR
jgi:hypothetical protein